MSKTNNRLKNLIEKRDKNRPRINFLGEIFVVITPTINEFRVFSDEKMKQAEGLAKAFLKPMAEDLKKEEPDLTGWEKITEENPDATKPANKYEQEIETQKWSFYIALLVPELLYYETDFVKGNKIGIADGADERTINDLKNAALEDVGFIISFRAILEEILSPPKNGSGR